MRANLVGFIAIYALVCYINTAFGATVNCMAPPRHVPLHMCCSLPRIFDDEVIEKCIQFIGQRPLPPMSRESNVPPATGSGMRPHRKFTHGMHPPPPCLAECIFNQTEVMDENANLNQEKFDLLVEKMLNDNPDLVKVAKASFATCANKIGDLKVKIDEKLKEHREGVKNSPTRGLNPICPPIAGMIWGCVNMETFRNCPTSAWNDSEECNASREYITECKKDKK